jgi:lysophospholipase
MRKRATVSKFTTWLKNMNITGMPTPSINNMPKVAIAFSGGGLRAMLSGARVFDGLDSRSTSAKPNLSDGKPTVNGLLDWAAYMTGTSRLK